MSHKVDRRFPDDLLPSEGKARIGEGGRILEPEELISATDYRPESRGRGLHVILERGEPRIDGALLPLAASQHSVSVRLLWFRLDDRPIEGTELWGRSERIIAPALAIALQGLAGERHLVIRGHDRALAVDPDTGALTEFIARHFNWWNFRAYCGPDPRASRCPVVDFPMADFVRYRMRDLARWDTVSDLVKDGGALEIWSTNLGSEQIDGRIDLRTMNQVLSAVDLTS